MQTGEKVAIKIVKRHPDYTLQAQGEIATFELLHQNYQDRDHPGQRNIGTVHVRLYEWPLGRSL